MDTREDHHHNRLSLNVTRLGRVLTIMFPAPYIELYHRPPHSPCTLFAMRSSPSVANRSDSGIADGLLNKIDAELTPTTEARFEPSSEPSSRARVAKLTEQFNASLIEHQAKQIGLCPIRRAIYDQCFDELIRQVTVGCIEQGLLLFRVRNELRMTLNYYRQIYESGVRFGLNKAIEAEIKIEEARLKIDQNLEIIGENHNLNTSNSMKTIQQSSVDDLNQLESLDRVKEYYQGELSKREHIIMEQRNIIETLTRKMMQTVKKPL